jgi:hypothetical protein
MFIFNMRIFLEKRPSRGGGSSRPPLNVSDGEEYPSLKIPGYLS